MYSPLCRRARLSNRKGLQSFRAIRVDAQVRVRPHTICTAQDPRGARRMGCPADYAGQAHALFALRQAPMYRDSATRNKTRRLVNSVIRRRGTDIPAGAQ
jgi:hypothetical protein